MNAQSSFLVSQDFVVSKHLGAFHADYEFQPLVFELLPKTYSICSMPADADINSSENIIYVMRDENETSVVCLAGYEPDGAQIEKDWRAIRIAQKLDFSMVGVVARIATLFASKDISVFVNSTYRTDYFFIKKDQIDLAIEALKEAQYEVIP